MTFERPSAAARASPLQLGRREAAQHGAARSLPEEGTARQPREHRDRRAGKPVPAHIAHDHRPSRQRRPAAHDSRRLLGAEVVQQHGGGDIVEGPRPERELERVAADDADLRIALAAPAGVRDDVGVTIDHGDAELDPLRARPLHVPARGLGAPAAHVEQAHRPAAVAEQESVQRPGQAANATEVAVGLGQAVQVAADFRGGAAELMGEILRLESSHHECVRRNRALILP